ncbi:hypothetical protein [Spirulina subsalsa]|uniref:hypothetical protein n=1 Tax=Spirulina subsalsa TaxID=54311 RepID=UPI00036624B6|nr:hypothetical protein [Spirulina subsalsa]
MFLEYQPTCELIEVMRIEDLFDPCLPEIMGRSHAGEEMQDPCIYPKADLRFPSGEPLPLCWIDPDYRIVRSPGNAVARSR